MRGLPAVLTQQALAATLGEGAPRAVCVDADADSIARESEVNPAQTSGPQDLAYVIIVWIDGAAEGRVMIERRSVVTSPFHASRAGTGFQRPLRRRYDAVVRHRQARLHGPLTAGGTVVLASRTTAADGVALAALLERNEATLLQATPATWRLLLESGWRGGGAEDAMVARACHAIWRSGCSGLAASGLEHVRAYRDDDLSTICRVIDASGAIPIRDTDREYTGVRARASVSQHRSSAENCALQEPGWRAAYQS